MPFEHDSWLCRNRATISGWVDRLGTITGSEDNPETEAASWYLALPKETRLRLDTDLDRLRSSEDDLAGVMEGPLGDLLQRYAGLMGLDVATLAFEPTRNSAEFRKLAEIDPLWFADWEGFINSLEDP